MRGNALPTPVVSTDWLAAHLSEDDLRILDGSWFLPQAGRDPQSEYTARHIPGALFCDLEAISDPNTALPHMLPSPEQFARDAGALGVGDDTRVIVYDTSGLNMSAARIWWMFRAFGHDRVAVLDGGLAKWKAEGRPVEQGAVRVAPRLFTPRPPLEQVRSIEQIRENLAGRQEQVVDARSPGRFAGTDPEPRPGLRGGHIPGSLNLPFSELVQADGTLLPPDILRSRFEAAGVELDRPVVTTCGSGTTACALLLALHVLGAQSTALYDGSWSEWGAV
jgi:thiosulfate/3-mercaptopyruvate sulfurtransferase